MQLLNVLESCLLTSSHSFLIYKSWSIFLKIWTCNDALVPSSTALHCLQPPIRVGSVSLARKDSAQLFQWHLKVFSGQHVPPAKHPGWQNTSMKASWMPIPPKLAPLFTEEQQFYSELLALSLRLGPTSLQRKLISAACICDLILWS